MPTPAPLGRTITYTATVSVSGPGSGTPTGTVSFSDTGSPISTCQDVAFTAPLQATCPQVYSRNNAGHTIPRRTYDGDTNFTGSTSAPYGRVVVAGVHHHIGGSAAGGLDLRPERGTIHGHGRPDLGNGEPHGGP